MKVMMAISGIILGLLMYYCILEPFISRNRYEGIVVKSYDREGKVYSEMIYVLDKQTGTRKRDWEK
jgi:hypothetical protein